MGQMASTKPTQEKKSVDASKTQSKRKNTKNLESSQLYRSSVKRLVRERLKDNYTISSASVIILSSIAFDFFNTIALSAGEIKGAIRLELGGKELSNNIIVDVETAIKKYT